MKRNKTTIQRNWQQRGYTRRRKTKQKHREIDNIGYTRQRKTKQKQSRETGTIGGTQDDEKQNDNPEATYWVHKMKKNKTTIQRQHRGYTR